MMSLLGVMPTKRSNAQHLVEYEKQLLYEDKKCHKHVTNAPKGIGLAYDTFEKS